MSVPRKPSAAPVAERCACGHLRAYHRGDKKAGACIADQRHTGANRGCDCERFKRTPAGREAARHGAR